MAKPILVGAVAYDPKVVSIWEVIRDYFKDRGVPVDYLLFSNYETQVEALFADHIQIAWNTPVAWVKARVRSEGRARALAMRDVDVAFTTKLVARPGGRVAAPTDLRGKTVALGSRDSGQAAILPVHFLEEAGLVERPPPDLPQQTGGGEGGEGHYTALRFDFDVGKHGDTGVSELEVLRAVTDGRADAGMVGDSTWGKLLAEGGVDPAVLVAVWTSPPYSHCNFTALPALAAEPAQAFVDGLMAMDYADPALRTMMDMEGLKRWVPGRTTGYEALEAAMRAQGHV